MHFAEAVIPRNDKEFIMRIIIDHIEGDIAVCELEDRRIVRIPLCVFPDAKDADIYTIEKDEEEQEERTSKARSLFDKLKKK